jgi:hypothetical protein
MPLSILSRLKPKKKEEDKKWAIILFELVQDGMQSAATCPCSSTPSSRWGLNG